MKKLFSYFIIFALFSIFIPSGHAVTSMTLENTSLHIACPESPELEKEILSSLQSAYNSNHQTSLAEGDYSNQVKFPTSVDFSTAIHIYVDTGIENWNLSNQAEILAELNDCTSVWVLPFQIGSEYATVTLAKGLPLNPAVSDLLTADEKTYIEKSAGQWTVTEVAFIGDELPYNAKLKQLDEIGVPTGNAVMIGGLSGILLPTLLVFENGEASYWIPMEEFSLPEEVEHASRPSQLLNKTDEDAADYEFYDYTSVIQYVQENNSAVQSELSGGTDHANDNVDRSSEFLPFLSGLAFLCIILISSLVYLRHKRR